MVDQTKIQEHADVIGSDGQHVGTVDHMEGTDRIKLTKKDSDAEGKHHFIPLSWVASVDESNNVVLNRTADDAHQQWQSEQA